MKTKILVVLFLSFFAFADLKDLFREFALQDEVVKFSKTSIKYRTILWLWLKTMSDLFPEHIKRQGKLLGLEENFPETVKVREVKSKLKFTPSIPCEVEGRICNFFLYRGEVYFILEELRKQHLFRYFFNVKNCEKEREVKFFYVSTFPPGETIGILKMNTIVEFKGFLGPNPQIKTEEILIENIYKYKNKIYIQRRRLIRDIPALEILYDREKKRIFYFSRTSPNTTEANILLQDTVFGIVNDRLYITFVYPLVNKVELYEYTLSGIPIRKIQFMFDQNYTFPKEWLNYDRIKESNVVYAVTDIFGINDKLYLTLEKNAIEGKNNDNISHLLIKIDLKNRVFSKQIFPYGLPVFYYMETIYSVSIPDRRIFKVKLNE